MEFLRHYAPAQPGRPQLPPFDRSDMLSEMLAPWEGQLWHRTGPWQWEVPGESLRLPEALPLAPAEEFFRHETLIDFAGAAVFRDQRVGPVTLAQRLFFPDGEPVIARLDAALRLARWCGAAMAALGGLISRRTGFFPVLTLDEPMAGGVDPALAGKLWAAALDETRAAPGSLGVHCCGAADWSALGPELTRAGGAHLHVDCEVSLSALLEPGAWLGDFVRAGGMVGWGLIPADGSAGDPEALAADLARRLEARFGGAMTRTILRQSTIGPACGLGLAGEKVASRVGEQSVRGSEFLRRKYRFD